VLTVHSFVSAQVNTNLVCAFLCQLSFVSAQSALAHTPLRSHLFAAHFQPCVDCYRIFIGNCPLIQVPVVLYRTGFAIFLSNEEETTGIWGFRAMDPLKMQVLGEELALFLFFFGRQRIYTTVNRGESVIF